MSSNLKVNTIQPSSGDTVSIAGIASITSSVSIASSCTATTFYGDGSNLTGVSGLSVGNQADNRLITCTGTTDTLNGESDLTFASNVLTLSGTFNVSGEVQIAENIVHSGDGNTAIGFPANDTIRCITAGSERIRIDSSGRVLIGTTTEGHIHADNLTIEDSGICGMTIRSGTSNSGNIYFSDGTSGSGEYIGAVEYSHSTNSLQLYVNVDERLRITNDGKVVAGGTGAGYPCRLQSHGAGDLLDLNSTSGAGKIRFYESGAGRFNIETLNGTAGLRFYDSLNAVERMRIHDDGGIQISTVRNVSAVASNTTGSFTSAELILTTPIYAEYHYTWSGQSNYTIDLTCASYFHSEFIYVQHQTNGGTGMQSYIRGKWANNHQTHTCQIHEWYGVTMGLDVTFVASDQSGNGAVNGEHGLTAAGWSNANYRGLYGGGGDNYDNTSSANGRLRITETYQGWGSVSTRGLIVRVYFGSFAISKS